MRIVKRGLLILICVGGLAYLALEATANVMEPLPPKPEHCYWVTPTLPSGTVLTDPDEMWEMCY